MTDLINTLDQASEYDALAKLRPGEPYFVLIGRDGSAPGLIDQWADNNRRRAIEPYCAGWKEESVKNYLKGLCCGFTDFRCPPNPTMDQHFTTRLDWLRETAPGVWEFHTTSPYTD